MLSTTCFCAAPLKAANCSRKPKWCTQRATSCSSHSVSTSNNRTTCLRAAVNHSIVPNSGTSPFLRASPPETPANYMGAFAQDKDPSAPPDLLRTTGAFPARPRRCDCSPPHLLWEQTELFAGNLLPARRSLWCGNRVFTSLVTCSQRHTRSGIVVVSSKLS